MFLVYYDEAGDDGFPKYSSPLFVLTCIYIHEEFWKETFENIREFRKELKQKFNMPVKTEFHMKYFLLNKHPFKDFGISDVDRIKLIDLFCDFLSKQKLGTVNVVINKTIIQKPDYEILDTALTYSIQRIENALNEINRSKITRLLKFINQSLLADAQKNLRVSEKFFIITDEGRLSKMRRTARKMQRINYIPSKFSSNAYNRTINLLVEDPISKMSDESYFIQISDLISYVVYMYSLNLLNVGKFAHRLPKELTHEKIKGWMAKLKPILNLKAANHNEFGIVIYPRTN